jgi:hypothetical protein
MPNQENTGFPRNKAAQGDEHSTTGDGHPPRTGQRAKQGASGSQNQPTKDMKGQSGKGGQQTKSPGRQK